MTLTPGTRLGPYEVTGPIGADGMGEVYRACDPKLNRFVAIKVLHGQFGDDPDRLARFEAKPRRSPRSRILASSPFTISAAPTA